MKSKDRGKKRVSLPIGIGGTVGILSQIGLFGLGPVLL